MCDRMCDRMCDHWRVLAPSCAFCVQGRGSARSCPLSFVLFGSNVAHVTIRIAKICIYKRAENGLLVFFLLDGEAMTSSQFRRACFTWFPTTEVSIEDVRSRLLDNSYVFVNRLRYLVCQAEMCPTSARIHLQGYFEIRSSTVTINMVRDVFPGVHVEKAKGTRNQARDYCMKVDTRIEGPWEFGTFTPTQGKRNDLEAAIEVLKSDGMEALIEEHPAVYVKFNRGLTLLADRLPQDPDGDQHFEPRAWQKVVVDTLAGEPDDRTIYWVTDGRGGAGKSRLARHLVDSRSAVYLSGKLADMALILKNALARPSKPQVAVFDITRAQAEHSDHLYTFAEMIKNCLVVSNKYESCQLRFQPMHVIFFSNNTWDKSKWSHDRVKEMNLAMPEDQQTWF